MSFVFIRGAAQSLNTPQRGNSLYHVYVQNMRLTYVSKGSTLVRNLPQIQWGPAPHFFCTFSFYENRSEQASSFIIDALLFDSFAYKHKESPREISFRQANFPVLGTYVAVKYVLLDTNTKVTKRREGLGESPRTAYARTMPINRSKSKTAQEPQGANGLQRNPGGTGPVKQQSGVNTPVGSRVDFSGIPKELAALVGKCADSVMKLVLSCVQDKIVDRFNMVISQLRVDKAFEELEDENIYDFLRLKFPVLTVPNVQCKTQRHYLTLTEVGGFKFNTETELLLGHSWLALLSAPSRGRPSHGEVLDDGPPIRQLMSDPKGKSLKRFVHGVLTGLQKSTVMAAESLCLWLMTLGYDVYRPQSYDWLLRFIDKSFHDFCSDRYEARMKYLCALVQARELDDLGQLPSRPAFISDSDTHFLGGAPYSWFNMRTSRALLSVRGLADDSKSKEQRLRFLNSITGLKKRQPEINKALVNRSVELWGPKIFTGPLHTALESRKHGSLVKSCVWEIVSSLKPWLTETVISVPVPSTAARINSKTRELGTLGYYDRAVAESVVNETQEWTLNGCVTVDYEGTSYTIVSAYPLTLQEFLQSTEELRVVPVGLPEPFKVRVISKGPAAAYFRASVIQKVVHSALQRDPGFQLTKESPDNDIVDVLNKTVGTNTLKRDQGYISGDYTAATDNADPLLAEFIVNCLADALRLSDSQRTLFVDALVNHVEALTGFLQRNGQLMGSPVSFPVLCIMNKAVTMAALMIHRPASKVTSRKLGVAVNGDDLGFKANVEEYRTWMEVAAEYGLTPSVGKNFWSRDFIQLNSQMFVMDRKSDLLEDFLKTEPSKWKGDVDRIYGALFKRSSDLFTWTPVPNHSLAVLSPPRSVSFPEYCLQAPSWNQTFLKGSKGEERDRLNSLYVDTWRSYLDQLPTGLMNWFVPRSLGGFGLVASRPVIMTTAQQHIAAWFRDNTDPEKAKLDRLRWKMPDSTTTVHEDSESFVKKLPFVKWGYLDEGVPFPLDTIEQAFALSGYSTGLEDFTMRSEPPYPWNLKEKPGFLSVIRPTGVVRQPILTDVVEPVTKKVGDVRYTWLSKSVSLLRKAASSTSRTMSPEDVLRYIPRPTGWIMPQGAIIINNTKIRVDSKISILEVSIVPFLDVESADLVLQSGPILCISSLSTRGRFIEDGHPLDDTTMTDI